MIVKKRPSPICLTIEKYFTRVVFTLLQMNVTYFVIQGSTPSELSMPQFYCVKNNDNIPDIHVEKISSLFQKLSYTLFFFYEKNVLTYLRYLIFLISYLYD